MSVQSKVIDNSSDIILAFLDVITWLVIFEIFHVIAIAYNAGKWMV